MSDEMAPVGWAYLPRGGERWHLCKDEPTAHSIREAVFLQSQVSAKDTEIERLRGNVETGNKMIVEQASEVARLNAMIERLSALLVEQTNRTNEVLAREDRLRDGIAEHKWTVSPYLYPDEIVHEHDRRLWALIEDGDDE